MTRGLFINGIDEIEGVLGEVTLIGFWIDPDGKELRAQVAGMGFVEADVADVLGIG
jgi:hypothetical protein